MMPIKVNKPHLSKKQWKTIILSSLGGGLEYYDFVIFIIFAQYIGKNFSYSSEENSFAQLFFAFSLFAVGYLARPIGGILFSHLGDKFGRKKAFSLSISIMAGSTLCMGLLPSYQTLGIAAPIIFTVLRIIQGLSLGGELPGAITFLKEHCPQKPGIACGILFFCVNGGIILAGLVHTLLLHFFSATELMDWAWRIAFYIGSSLAILAYFLRKRLEETPDFIAMQQHIKTIQRVPLLSLLKNHSKQVFGVIITFALFPLSLTLLLLYISSYLSFFPHLEASQIAHIALINAIIVSSIILIFGYLIDRWLKNYRKLLILSALLFLLLGPVIFHFVLLPNCQHIGLLLSALCVLVGIAAISSVLLLAHSFPPNVRYSGIALCYNISFAIFAGLSPLAASYFINSHGLMMAPAYLLQGAAVLTLIGLFSLSKINRAKNLSH